LLPQSGERKLNEQAAVLVSATRGVCEAPRAAPHFRQRTGLLRDEPGVTPTMLTLRADNFGYS